MKFALITEGASEYRVIKQIVSKYFKDQDPDINQIQPKLVNDKQQGIGGWNEVLKYCAREDLKEIFVENDFLVIQVDTDQSATLPFDVTHSKPDGTAKTAEELYDDITNKLKNLIQIEIRELHEERIFFAICIHTIECWLLPLYYTNHNRTSVRNCFSTLNLGLRRQNILPIPREKNNPIGIRVYETILKSWKRRQDIDASSVHNHGFAKFVSDLQEINIDN